MELSRAVFREMAMGMGMGMVMGMGMGMGMGTTISRIKSLGSKNYLARRDAIPRVYCLPGACYLPLAYYLYRRDTSRLKIVETPYLASTLTTNE